MINCSIWYFWSFFDFLHSNVPGSKCCKQKWCVVFFICIKLGVHKLAYVHAIAQCRRLSKNGNIVKTHSFLQGIITIITYTCFISKKISESNSNDKHHTQESKSSVFSVFRETNSIMLQNLYLSSQLICTNIHPRKPVGNTYYNR